MYKVTYVHVVQGYVSRYDIELSQNLPVLRSDFNSSRS